MENYETRIISVLGLKWDRKTDTLAIDVSRISIPEKITKRSVLSTIQKIFDPIGFVVPATFPMKILLQRTWLSKQKWDDDLSENGKNQFQEWCENLKCLPELRIPRRATVTESDRKNWRLHVFTDASSLTYAAVVYLRMETGSHASVQLIAAKSRAARIGKVTITRLELLGCLIGARLTSMVKKAWELEEEKVTYWSDSTTALAWIRDNDKWGTFVGNRTTEIAKLTNVENWRFVPGKRNPADLPSRGCSFGELKKSEWWLGPDWLHLPEQEWPSEPEVLDDEAIVKERKKTRVITTSVLNRVQKRLSISSLIRVTGWIMRFIRNTSKKDISGRRTGNLTKEEISRAEVSLIRSLQQHFQMEKGKHDLNGLMVIHDADDVLRVKTRLTNRNDEYDFRFPFLLPGRHPITQHLIWDNHVAFCHAGAGFLVAHLRKRFWIIHARRSVKHVIDRCYRCRQFQAKGTITEVAALPEDRVRSAEPFEVTGVDLAGPFILKNQKKTWLVIYTCANYRAVHFDVVDTISTGAFLKSLERFVTKFRRPATIYSENGTNFKGAVNFFKKLNWPIIMEKQGTKMIEWKFNVSAASWWGGFWERLIRSAKELIRRSLGRSQVNKFEFDRCLTSVAEVMNGRPLTYLSEDPDDLEVLTPNMFLHPYDLVSFPESDLHSADKMRFRYTYVQTLTNELRERWRKEYLGMLVAKVSKPTRTLVERELVVVSQEGKKRHEWDVARIQRLIPGKDGISRVAMIKTKDGEYLRPVQRLYPLELDQETANNEHRTRRGRYSKPPARYGQSEAE